MITRDEEARRKRLSEFLMAEFERWSLKQRRIKDRSLTKWASSLKVPVANLSHYINMTRTPTGDVIYQLAAYWPEILDILDLPPATPNDPLARELILLWLDPKVPEERKERALNILRGEGTIKEYADRKVQQLVK